jgi:hypothetical protein
VPPGARQAALTHEVSDLVRGFRVGRPEVPLHVVVAQARIGQALLTANEVWELHRVAYEEHGGVVADQVVVALIGIKLQREAAHVPPGVRTARLAGHGGEARQHLGLGALLEQRGFRVPRHILGGLEDTKRAGTLGVRLAFRHFLAIEVRHLLQKMHVVQ